MNAPGFAFIFLATVGLGLSQTTPMAFEVASIKPHPVPRGQTLFRFTPPSGTPVLRVTGNRFTEGMATVQNLIMSAHRVKEFQILDMPDWVRAPRGEHYDIEAKSPGDETPSQEQLRLMLQSLLADRFQLKLRHEIKETSVYALVIGKNGPKARALTEVEIEAMKTQRVTGPFKGTIPQLIADISRKVDLPVIDHTGLTGTYEFADLDRMQFGLASDRDSVFGDIQDRAGLKLEARPKEKVEVLVIEHVERPSGN